ncbi:LTA synthase family protein [Clostridium sp. UBA4548]|uniref:LTA synthase family protein n=1 Tax=Clostridium sp. UBA4548 TaxID=1946361 RepID=UPI0025C339DD|nr:LTA synthase family protein [Clostridium sp. UBA4548]
MERIIFITVLLSGRNEDMLSFNSKNKNSNKIKNIGVSLLKEYRVFFFILAIFTMKNILFTALIQSSGASMLQSSNLKISALNCVPYILFSTIILAIIFLIKGKLQWKIVITLDIALTLIIISDLFYYRGFSSYVNFYLLDQLSMTEDLGGSIIALFRSIDILFILDFLLLPFIIKRKSTHYRNTMRKPKIFFLLIALSSFLLVIYYTDFNIGEKTTRYFVKSTLDKVHMPNDKMVLLGPIGYHIYDGYSYYSNKKPYNLSQKELKDIEEFYKDKEENLKDNAYKGYFKGKNLLLIQVESLENFVINREVQGQEITPNINKLLNNSLYFDNFHEQVWNGNSSDCDLLVNGSVYPVREGTTFYRYPNNYYPHSLPNVMKTLDYNTYVVHPDTSMYWNYKPALSSMGFDKLYFAEDLGVEEKIGLGISDKEYFKKATDIIKKQEQPFYGMTVTITSHTPFNLPKEDKALNLDENLEETEIGRYFQAIHYTDKQIGSFIESLEIEGILDNTVVVLYGDHTGVHKYFQDKINGMKNKENWWNDNNNKIPLLIYNKSSSAKIINTYGGPVDLVPTLGYLMGADEKKYKTAMGRNLLNTNKDFVILSNFEVRGNITKAEKEKYKNYLILSEKIIRSNYFLKHGN